jgi:hypothetical protein
MSLTRRLAFVCACSVGLLTAQQNARFATLKEQAFAHFERGQYDQMAGKLEEIWESDQSDAKVAEYLGMGYMYGEHSLNKAKPVMKAAIEHGGQATFLVQHSHERGRLLSGDTMNNFCTGKLSIMSGKMAFTADSGEHSTTFTSADAKDFRILGGSPGRIQIKSSGKNLTFRVKTGRQDEAQFLEDLVIAYLKKN